MKVTISCGDKHAEFDAESKAEFLKLTESAARSLWGVLHPDEFEAELEALKSAIRAQMYPQIPSFDLGLEAKT